MRVVDPGYLAAEHAIARAAAAGDAAAVHRGMAAPRLPARARRTSIAPRLLEQLLAGAEWYFEPGERRITPAYVTGLMERSREYLDDLRRMTLPPQALLIRRMEGLVFQTLGELRASADWAAIGAEYHADAAALDARSARSTPSSGATAGRSPAPPSLQRRSMEERPGPGRRRLLGRDLLRRLLGGELRRRRLACHQHGRDRDQQGPEDVQRDRERRAEAVARLPHQADGAEPHRCPGATMRRVDANQLRRWCIGQPGAIEDFPFGPEHSVFKVAGKMFALSALDRAPLEVSVKCEPDLAVALRASYPAIRPGYHLNKRHWNTITLDGSLPDQLVRDLIEDSYDLVVSALPKRVRDQLGWAPDADSAA